MTDFLEAVKALRPKKEVYIEELQQTLVVRCLSVREMDECNKLARKPVRGNGKADAAAEVDNELLMTSILAASLETEDGQRLVPKGRETELLDMPQKLFNTLQEVVLEINSVGQQEDLEKNSETTRGVERSSSSRSRSGVQSQN